MINVAIAGCSGRMGIALIHAAQADEELVITGGLVSSQDNNLGLDLGTIANSMTPANIPATDDPNEAFDDADVILDFTTPDLTVALADYVANHQKALITGTTGLNEQQQAQLEQATKHAVIVQSFNMSLGVNLLAALVEQAAQKLDEDFDIEILEMHHRHKVDAPSGTAILLGESAAKGRDVTLHEVADSGRDGITGERRKGDIGFAALRGGGVVGDHHVIFASDHERIELTHKSSSRDIYAAGAIKATHWSQKQSAGLYSMKDVLDI